jgi:hypothetical protein
MTQTSTHELWVSDNTEDAVRKTKLTLKKLGDLTAVVPNQHVVGTVASGVQHISLKVSWRPEEIETKMDRMISGNAARAAKTLGTLLIVEASIEGHGPTGNDASLRSATERFEDAYMHFDRADYQPDRVGFLPATIVGILVLIALLGVLLAKKTNLFKPTPVPSPSASAGAPLIAP